MFVLCFFFSTSLLTLFFLCLFTVFSDCLLPILFYKNVKTYDSQQFIEFINTVLHIVRYILRSDNIDARSHINTSKSALFGIYFKSSKNILILARGNF
jgi:hypothetical protein